MKTTEFDSGEHTQVAEEGNEAQAPGLARGHTVGRYLIVDVLGMGGMGAVYRAFDPELNRPVALKLLLIKSDKPQTQDATSQQDRLLREAQALAQLSHPNIVTVFDVGTHEDAIFMAMELVEGQTLKEWLKQEPRSIQEIISVATAAGHGLSAAHRAGIIHRDFKPSNIIIGNDGRVRVLDFGLARALEETETIPSKREERSKNKQAVIALDEAGLDSSRSLLSSSITREGAIVGTPHYMAPEQHRHQVVDERCDQFGFAVVLFEALHGQRPFQAKTYKDLREQVSQGHIVRPADSSVPAWIDQILDRGLIPDPAQRFANMAALLTALAKDPAIEQARLRARRLRWAGGLGALLLIALSVFALWFGMSSRARLCAGAEEKLAGVWDPVKSQQLHARLLATNRPHAADTFKKMAAQLSKYADDWVIMRNESCQATHVLGEQSEHLLDLRMHCLDQRKSELQALVNLFATRADAAMLDKAVMAALGLRRINSCADTETLRKAYPPPENPAQRKQVEQIEQSLDTVRALEKAGKYREALAAMVDLSSRAKLLGHPPTQALTLQMRGTLELRSSKAAAAKESIEQALQYAAVSRNDSLIADLLTDLVFVVGHLQARYAEALQLCTIAQAAVTRAGNKPVQRANVLNYLSTLLWRQGKNEQAIESQQQALALRKEAFGPDHPSVAVSLNNLGDVLMELKRYDQAQKVLNQAYSNWEKAFGPNHPYVGYPLTNLGVVLLEQGKYPQAKKVFARALSVWEQGLGADNPLLTHPLTGLAQCLLPKDHQTALPLLERALLLKLAHPSDPAELAEIRFTLARAVWLSDSNHARALQLANQAASDLTKSSSPKPKLKKKIGDWLRTKTPF